MTTPATYYFDQWTELRAKLQMQATDDLCTGYFAGYVPKGYQDAGSQIVYVCASVPGYGADIFGPGPYPLKDDPAALDFTRALGGFADSSSDPSEIVAVTSLCKIALENGEVSPQLLMVQQQLAVQTLRYEIYALAPRLIVFCCGGKFSAAIRETVNASRGSLADVQTEGEGIDAIAFRVRGNAGEPAVLILQPPNAVSTSVRANWLARAAVLLRQG